MHRASDRALEREQYQTEAEYAAVDAVCRRRFGMSYAELKRFLTDEQRERIVKAWSASVTG